MSVWQSVYISLCICLYPFIFVFINLNIYIVFYVFICISILITVLWTSSWKPALPLVHMSHCSVLHFSILPPSVSSIYSNTLPFHFIQTVALYTSSYTYTIYLTSCIYHSHCLILSHSVQVTKLLQSAAFYHSHYSTVCSFSLTRHANPSVSSSITFIILCVHTTGTTEIIHFHCLDSRNLIFIPCPVLTCMWQHQKCYAILYLISFLLTLILTIFLLSCFLMVLSLSVPVSTFPCCTESN